MSEALDQANRDKETVLSRLKELEEIANERLTALLQAEGENTALRTQLADAHRLLANGEHLLKVARRVLKRKQSEDRP